MADDAHYLAALKKELVAAPERKVDITAEIDRVQPIVDALAEAKAERVAAVEEAKAAGAMSAADVREAEGLPPEPDPLPVKKVAKSRKAAK